MHTRDCRKSFFLRKIESRADHESRLICATWHRATYPTQLNLINMPNRVGVPPDSGSKINAPGCQLKQNTQLINMPNRVGILFGILSGILFGILSGILFLRSSGAHWSRELAV